MFTYKRGKNYRDEEYGYIGYYWNIVRTSGDEEVTVFKFSQFAFQSIDLYRYVSGTRYRTNLFSIWQHGENAANKSLESHSGDGVGLRRTRM